MKISPLTLMLMNPPDVQLSQQETILLGLLLTTQYTPNNIVILISGIFAVGSR